VHGSRAAAFARLTAAGIPVPPAFVLSHDELARLAGLSPSSQLAPLLPRKLPSELADALSEAVSALALPVAVRRSAVDPGDTRGELRSSRPAGRPERETYLNLVDHAEVIEAIRRIWSTISAAGQRCAILVQRFLVAQISATVRRDRADDKLLHVQASYGVGDLLAAGLVVPDRYTIRRDGEVVSRTIGRKAQMTIAKVDGGIVRVPVPANQAREAALAATHLNEIARLWASAEAAIGPLRTVSFAFCPHAAVTAAVSAPAASDSGLMLG
jgi:phosphoenolpyruvate synthase/pyruvate phosphate dikinase